MALAVITSICVVNKQRHFVSQQDTNNCKKEGGNHEYNMVQDNESNDEYFPSSTTSSTSTSTSSLTENFELEMNEISKD